MADVSIVRCASYDADECRAALEAAIAAVGGLYTAAHLNHVYDVTGLRACEAAGAQFNQNFA